MGRYISDYNFSDIRKDYFKYKISTISVKQYSQFLKELNKELVQWVIAGNILYLPFGLGNIYVERHEYIPKTEIVDGITYAKSGCVDYGETQKLRKSLQPTWTNEDWKKIPYHERPIVFHTNEHTQGHVFFIKWIRPHAAAKIKMHQFIPADKAFKRLLAKVLKSDDINKPTYYDKREIRKYINDTGTS